MAIDPETPNTLKIQKEARDRIGHRSSILGILVNFGLFVLKFVMSVLSGSISLRGDAINNLTDAASSMIALISFRLSRKPADDKHPFGHARTEYIGTSAVAVIILLLAYELGRQSLDQILRPKPVDYSIWVLVALVISIFTKIALFLYYRHQGRAIQSDLLLATSRDALGDVMASSAVLIAAIVSMFTDLKTDGFLGLLVALFIAYSGISILKETLDRMLGQSPDSALTDAIRDTLLGEEAFLGIHDLVVHDYGPGRQFATVHVEVDALEPILETHEHVDRLERRIRSELGVDLLIHMDPIILNDPRTNARRTEISMLVASIDTRLSVHDFRIVDELEGTHLIFDVTLPGDWDISDEQLRQRIIQLIQQRSPDERVTITLDRAYTSN